MIISFVLLQVNVIYVHVYICVHTYIHTRVMYVVTQMCQYVFTYS